MRPSSILITLLAAMVFASHSATAADVTPPRLESWEVYPAAVNVSDSAAEVYVEFRVTDDQSQIQTPSVTANSLTTSQSTGFGDVTVISSSNGGLDVTYRAVLSVRKGAAPGPWETKLFPVSDELGNTQIGFGPPDEFGKIFTVVEDEPADESTLQVTLEEPAAGLVHMGVGNLRGWAVSSVGIRKVEAYLDGEFLAEIPYGGTRGDVGAVFPDISGSRLSGFSMSLNYSGLSEGSHTLEIIAESIDNKTMSSSVEFQTIRLDSEFIGPGEVIDLNTAASVLSGDEIRVENILIAGKYYNLLLRWRTAEQGFEIVEIEALDRGGSSSSDGSVRTFRDFSSTIDVGNAGNVPGSTVRLEIPERTVAVVGLALSLNGDQEGRIDFAPVGNWASVDLSLWISETPDGASVSESCRYKGYAESSVRFSLDGSRSCSLGAGEYFVNFAACSSEPEDWTCSFDAAVMNDQELEMILRSRFD